MKIKTIGLGVGILALSAFMTSCHDDDTTIIDNPNPGTEEITPSTDVTAMVDPDFAEVLKSKGYIDNAAQIIDSTLKKITVLDIAGNPLAKTGKLTSLKGIELMTNLKMLKCNSQEIESLDLSKNVNLTEINASNNDLTELILPAGAPLTIVNAGRNDLTQMSVVGYPTLERLDLSDNDLTSLTMSGLTGLTVLYINDNELASADISESTSLTAFGCDENPGTAGVFTVKAWFTNSNIPSANFTSGSWTYENQTVAVSYTE